MEYSIEKVVRSKGYEPGCGYYSEDEIVYRAIIWGPTNSYGITPIVNLAEASSRATVVAWRKKNYPEATRRKSLL